MTRSARRLALVVFLALGVPATALEWSSFEGPARGFPVLRGSDGQRIADGDFAQWIEDGALHVRISYSAGDRRMEEAAVLRQRPALVQDTWSFRELRGDALYREFKVDFTRGTASAQKRSEQGQLERWTEEIEIDRSRAFAGFAHTLAIKALRARLVRGERIQLQTVGFTPKPRVVTVELSYDGIDRLRMSRRAILGEHFVVHPKLPFLANLFVDVPDAHIWLTAPPATFLRFEGPLAEPSDPVTRVDVLPGDPSEPASRESSRPKD